MNHRSATFVGGSDLENLNASSFTYWAKGASAASKPILIVIDASLSWAFVRRIHLQLNDPMEAQGSVAHLQHIAIVASAKRTSYTSLPMISDSEDLVHMVPAQEMHMPVADPRRARHRDRDSEEEEEGREASDDAHEEDSGEVEEDGSVYVDGLLVNNSMFTRRLIWRTAYDGTLAAETTVGEIETVLNGRTEMCYGFQAKLFCVEGASIRGLSLRSFFPWRPLAEGGNTPVPFVQNRVIGGFIPSEEILIDDVYRWWGVRGRTSIRNYQNRAILMSRDLKRPGLLETDVTQTIGLFEFSRMMGRLPSGHAAVVVMKGQHRGIGENTGPLPGIPLGRVLYALLNGEGRGVRRDFDFSMDYCDDVRDSLRQFGCGVLISESPCLDRITGICHAIDRRKGTGTYFEVLEQIFSSLAPRPDPVPVSE
jgi:hypothetical protein